MKTIFRTVVAYLPPTPLGLLPGEWMIEHRCTVCHDKVVAEDLVDHAQAHAGVAIDGSPHPAP